MNTREKFLSSAALREKAVDIEFNGEKLPCIIRVNSKRDYVQKLHRMTDDATGFQLFSGEILSVEDRTPLFTADEYSTLLPDAFVSKLFAAWVEAQTGRPIPDELMGELLAGRLPNCSVSSLHDTSGCVSQGQ